MDTPSMVDFPDELERLAEWRRRRAKGEHPIGSPGDGGEPPDPEPPAEARER